LALDGALRLCQAGAAQGAVRSELWRLCSSLSEHDLVAAMVLYDALVKDTAHEGDVAANVRAAAGVRAKTITALTAKVGSGPAAAAGSWAPDDIRWLWLAVRVVGCFEGALQVEEMDREQTALAQLEAVVDAAAAAIGKREVPAAAVQQERKLGRRTGAAGGDGTPGPHKDAAGKEEREAAMVGGREAQLVALAGSCRHLEDKAALLVEATRALLAVSSAIQRLPGGRAAGGGGKPGKLSTRKKGGKGEGAQGASASAGSGEAMSSAAGALGGKAAAAVEVLLKALPHSTAAVDFLFELAEMGAEGGEQWCGQGSAQAAAASRPRAPVVSFDEAFQALHMNLITADESLRRATLRLWLQLLPQSALDTETGAGYDLFAVNPERATVEVMLGIEEAPMDAIHGKARILRFQQLQTAIQAGKVPGRLHPALVPFYIGQLRTRFTLPWKQIREGLAAMAAHMPAHLWPPLLAHASICIGTVNFSLLRPAAMSCEGADDLEEGNGEDEDEGDDEDDEEEQDAADREEQEEAKVKKSKGRAGKRALQVPKAVKMRLRRLAGPRGLQERVAATFKAHHFSGTPQIDVLTQLLAAAAADAKYLQNHSKFFVQVVGGSRRAARGRLALPPCSCLPCAPPRPFLLQPRFCGWRAEQGRFGVWGGGLWFGVWALGVGVGVVGFGV